MLNALDIFCLDNREARILMATPETTKILTFNKLIVKSQHQTTVKNLKNGKILPELIIRKIPKELFGVPIEEIDEYNKEDNASFFSIKICCHVIFHSLVVSTSKSARYVLFLSIPK